MLTCLPACLCSLPVFSEAADRADAQNDLQNPTLLMRLVVRRPPADFRVNWYCRPPLPPPPPPPPIQSKKIKREAGREREDVQVQLRACACNGALRAALLSSETHIRRCSSLCTGNTLPTFTHTQRADDWLLLHTSFGPQATHVPLFHPAHRFCPVIVFDSCFGSNLLHNFVSSSSRLAPRGLGAKELP